jgi:Putative Actinobacterial Holin-X, holin superfamily III
MNKETVHEETLASLATSLQHHFIELLDVEKEIARQEIAGKLKEIKRDALLVAGGAVVGGLFLLCLTSAAILALSIVTPPWTAALIVASPLGLVAAYLMLRFKGQSKQLDPVPRRTIASLKRDIIAVQEAVR